MKTKYNLKEKVWIHIGERKLVGGRVVEIIDLEHLEEGHSRDLELYIIELKTGIDDIYEVRTFDQISPDEKGPINLFKKHSKELSSAKRYLKKVGVSFPTDETHIVSDLIDDLDTASEEPTPEEIHAAMDRSMQVRELHKRPTVNPASSKPPRKRFYKKKKNDA
jgi:hypothetical protein